MNAVQKFWLPAFAFSAWLSSNALAFFAFDIQLSGQRSGDLYVAGWSTIGTAVIYSLLLTAPRLFSALKEPKLWFFASIFSFAALILLSNKYLEMREDWVCPYEGLSLIVGVHHEDSCAALMSGIAGDVDAQFSDQADLRKNRFHQMARIYSSIWYVLSALLISIFQAHKYSVRRHAVKRTPRVKA